MVDAIVWVIALVVAARLFFVCQQEKRDRERDARRMAEFRARRDEVRQRAKGRL